jgi:hypothetical protein
VNEPRVFNQTALLGAGIVSAALVALYFFPPGEYAFYPRCIFHLTTGLLCPGCGSLRATHQLLHGDLAAAFLLNPLLLFLMGWLAGLSVLRFAEKRLGRKLFPIFQRPFWTWALVVLIVVFGVVRNLSFFPGTA